MTDDIVTRLRELLDYKDGGWPSDSLAWLLADAADKIERLERFHSLCTAAIKELAVAEYRKSGDSALHWMDQRDAAIRAEALNDATVALNRVWEQEARRG